MSSLTFSLLGVDLGYTNNVRLLIETGSATSLITLSYHDPLFLAIPLAAVELKVWMPDPCKIFYVVTRNAKLSAFREKVEYAVSTTGLPTQQTASIFITGDHS